MPGVWEDVKGRKIFKAATLYAAVTWGIIQIADVLLPVLRYPEWVMSSMVIAAFSGFPIALIFGWMLDIKKERLILADQENLGNLKSSMSSRLIEVSIILAFIGCAALLYSNLTSLPVKTNIEPLPSVEELIAPSADQKTIAVLPFVSFGSSPEDEYFADGLSEELLNVLARNKNLRVAARTSSFQYKNQNINVKTIARELGVQYILEGSVRRSGNLIRVTAQLIKADEDVHIFSSSWDKDTTNIFKVQDEIAQSVLDTLEIKLLGKEPAKSDVGTQDIAAFAEYSRGVAYVRNRNKEDFDKAIIHLKKALMIDVNYAEANAMLAEVYLLKLSYGLIEKEVAFEQAKPYIDKSLKINSELAEGHAVMGLFLWQSSDIMNGSMEVNQKALTQAKFHLNKAIDLNPSNAEAYMWYGTILQKQGELENGSKLYKKAFQIDPQAAVVGFNRGQDLVRMGRYKEAMAVFNTIVRNNPNYANAYQIAGDVSFSVGQLDQAYNMFKRISELSGDDVDWLWNANRILIPVGQFELAQQNLEKLKKSSHSKHGYNDKYAEIQANIWLASKEVNKFHEWVETFEENSKRWRERLWRGFASLIKKDWRHAIEDLEKSIQQLNAEKHGKNDESIIRINLLLAKGWNELGDKIKRDFYLEAAERDINLLQKRQSNHQILRYQQAAHAVLSEQPMKALSYLRQALQEGFVDVWLIEADPSFDSVRDDPVYAAIMREYHSKMNLMWLNIQYQNNKFAFGH